MLGQIQKTNSLFLSRTGIRLLSKHKLPATTGRTDLSSVVHYSEFKAHAVPAGTIVPASHTNLWTSWYQNKKLTHFSDPEIHTMLEEVMLNNWVSIHIKLNHLLMTFGLSSFNMHSLHGSVEEMHIYLETLSPLSFSFQTVNKQNYKGTQREACQLQRRIKRRMTVLSELKFRLFKMTDRLIH